MSKKRSAFTLVELLVVIGIIALLLGILLPTLSRARDAGNSTRCLANMRQAAMAVTFYLNENKGRWLPPYKAPIRTENWVPNGNPSWSGPLFYTFLSGLYYKGEPGIWICPSDRYIENDLTAAVPRLYGPQRDSKSSYFINLDMPKFANPVYPAPYDHASYFNPRPLKYVKSPTKLILYGEKFGPGGMFSYRSASTAQTGMAFEHRKRNAMSLCFADGHAEQLDRSEIMLRAGETTHGPVRLREYWYGHPTYATPQLFAY